MKKINKNCLKNHSSLICNICGSNNIYRIYIRKQNNNLYRCLNCNLIFIHPQLSIKELKSIYSKIYFKNNDSQVYGYQNYIGDKSNIIKTSEKRIKDILKIYPNKGKILDIGCATGFFLESAKRAGLDVYGVDISNYAVSMVRKDLRKNIYQGLFLEYDFPDEYFDIITAWDYIEHSLDPKQDIQKAYRLLKKSGLLVLATPDIDSLPARIMKDKWMGFKDIEHLFFFSKRTIKKIIQDVDFCIIKQKYIGKYIDVRFFIKRMEIYSIFLSKILKFFIPKVLLSTSIYVNPRDILCVYIRKKK
ncbi:MAG: class I SAM-dependent methyltransferase [Patescibacteria group bacterium]